MNEAIKTGLNYNCILKIASQFLDLNILEDYEKKLTLMGCNIVYGNNNYFCKVNGVNDFTVYISKDLIWYKKFLIFQAFGHYVLNGLSGTRPCVIYSSTKSDASCDGILFSLSVLLPQDPIKRLREKNISIEEIANIYNLPKSLVEMKFKLMERCYGK